jgi:NADPH-dependent glutamate synthase beta subunit-like oxidoreductase
MEDPEVFTKPWQIEDTLRLRPNERIREYECIENNNDNLLRFEKLLKSAGPPAKP